MPYLGSVLFWADGRVTVRDGEIAHFDTVRVPVQAGVDTNRNSPRYGDPVFGCVRFRRTGETDASGRCIFREVDQ